MIPCPGSTQRLCKKERMDLEVPVFLFLPPFPGGLPGPLWLYGRLGPLARAALRISASAALTSFWILRGHIGFVK